MARGRKKNASPAIDLAGLETLTVDQLRSAWTDEFDAVPANRVSRELLVRAIGYRLQEKAEGGLTRKEARQLDRLTGGASADQPGRENKAPAVTLRPGNRLVREWQGRVHEVIVLGDQFLWKGEQYRSLSEIARLITGAHWSGPRFFGLTGSGGNDKRRSKSMEIADG